MIEKVERQRTLQGVPRAAEKARHRQGPTDARVDVVSVASAR
jgi:hypothetical protein